MGRRLTEPSAASARGASVTCRIRRRRANRRPRRWSRSGRQPTSRWRKRSAVPRGSLDASEAVPALIEALKDTDAGVREQVAWALGAIGDRRAVDGLVGALSDSAPGVRKQAAWALGELGDSRAVSGLTKCLKDADAGVRKQAAWALGAIGG